MNKDTELPAGNALNAQPSNRYYDLDWLRLFATIGVFLFHAGRAFDFGDWHIKNDVLSDGFDNWEGFLAIWIMPLMFLMSGASIALALRVRSMKQFLRERVKRLLVPLLFGILMLAPPQVYLERLSRDQFAGSFLEFFPQYFNKPYLGVGGEGNFAWMGLHLWYLLALLIFTFLLFPVLNYLRREDVQGSLRQFLEKPTSHFVAAIPLMILSAVLNPDDLGFRELGSWNMWIYMLLVIYGFMLITAMPDDARFYRQRWVLFGLSLLAGVITVVFEGDGYFSLNYAIENGARAFSSWGLLLALVGFFYPLRTRTNALLRYSQDLVLPFYMLHQTVIVIFGYNILKSNADPLLKYGLIIVTSLPVILGLYEFLIRRVNVLRFLFGLKPRPAAMKQEQVKPAL